MLASAVENEERRSDRIAASFASHPARDEHLYSAELDRVAQRLQTAQ